jgi:PhoH-like ATPase
MTLEHQAEKKIYILDTNVLIHDPAALFAFGPREIGIPGTVLEELDLFKKEGTDRGRNAREAVRILDELRSRGSLHDGVMLDDGSLVRVLFIDQSLIRELPFLISVEDNKILLTALTEKKRGYEVIFVSKDLNARVKADALGLQTADYKKEYVTPQEFYRGWIRISVPAIDLKREVPQQLLDMRATYQFAPNEFAIVESQHNPYNYRVYRYLADGSFKPVSDPKISWPLKARNAQQLMALDLLFDEEIPFVCLFGPAGTGKTFLALVAALYKVLIEEAYKKLLISRPVIPLGRDIGYLPGTLEEKLHSWMLPIYDNIELIAHEVNAAMQSVKSYEAERRGKWGRRREYERPQGSLSSIEELVREHKLSLEAITYMRGRSIPFQFILIDEVQNLTPHEVKTLISRVGEGSKLVLAGDPYQIDSPYLDFSSNGLVIASERFKGERLFGTVYLETSERSELSELASKLL